MFCPLKLYFESNIDGKAEEDYFIPKTLKNLRMDIQDLLHKNLRHVKKDMNEREIEKMLAIGINNLKKIRKKKRKEIKKIQKMMKIIKIMKKEQIKEIKKIKEHIKNSMKN